MKINSSFNFFTKLVSFFLVVILVFYFMPSTVYAEMIDTFTSGNESIDTENVTETDSRLYGSEGPIFEVEELREESVKHFRLADGSYVAAQYDYPVHTVNDNGVWEDINNVLADDNGGVFATSNARIKFSKKINGSAEIFTLKDGNTKLSMSLIGAKKHVEGEVTNFGDSEYDTELQKMMNLEKLAARVLYPDILDGVDVEYVLQSLNVKENIIVKEPKNSYNYSFEMKLNGLEAELSENGDVILRETQNEVVKYTIPAPLVYDAMGEVVCNRESAYYTLNGKNGKYILTVSVSPDWMNAEDRVFPVTIDPTVIEGVQSYVEDTFLNTAVDVMAYGKLPYISIHKRAVGFWKLNRLPELPNDSYLSEVLLSLNYGSSQGRYCHDLQLHKVLSDWSEDTLSGLAFMTKQEGIIENTAFASASMNENFKYVWDITELANDWYEAPSSNYGVAIKISGSAPFGLNFTTRLQSKESLSVSSDISMNTPTMHISYKKLSGIEDYFAYSSQSAGVGGDTAVNNAGGNLVLLIKTLSTTDQIIPFTSSLVYNSQDSAEQKKFPGTSIEYPDSFLPDGFKLNSYEIIAKDYYRKFDGDISIFYWYEDADGTGHPFFASNDDETIYFDNDGLQMRLSILEDGNISITDDSKLIKTYTSASSNDNLWILTEIKDLYGNKINFELNSDYRPISVSVTPNRKTTIEFLEFIYNSSNTLCAVYNVNNKNGIIFRYANEYNGEISVGADKYLRKLEHIDPASVASKEEFVNYSLDASAGGITSVATAEYEYLESGKITRIKDNLAGQSIDYLWTGEKVSEVTQYAGNLQGQKISFCYGVGYTDVRSSGNDEILNTDDDVITRYIFDEYGRAISAYSTSVDGSSIYGATTGKYEEQENVKNNLKESFSTGGSETNYVLNGSFQSSSSENDIEHWTLSANAKRKSDAYGNYYVSLNPTANTTASVSQYVFLEAGEYTLSMPITAFACEGLLGRVNVSSIGNSGFSHTEKIALTNEASRQGDFATTFTVGNVANGGDTLKISIELSAGSSVQYLSSGIKIDNVMLSKNVGAEVFSLVNMGSFDKSTVSSAGEFSADVSDYWLTEEDEAPTVIQGMNGNGIKISADIEKKDKYVKQRIYEVGEDVIYDYEHENDFPTIKFNFILSGFAKVEEILHDVKASFALKAVVGYIDGSEEEHVFEFQPYCEGWQYVCGAINTAEANDTLVEFIDVYCVYSKQLSGFAIFDNISVINCDSADKTDYFYYENGLLAGAENAFYQEYYEYDDNRNLVRIANSYGEIVDYFYDSDGKHVNYEVRSDFVSTITDGPDYPYQYEDPSQFITLTTKSRTDYSYDSHGLLYERSTYEVIDPLTPKTGTKYITEAYTYVLDSSSPIFGAKIEETNGFGERTFYYYNNDGRLAATVSTRNVADTSSNHQSTGLAYEYDTVGNLISVVPAKYVSSTSFSEVNDSVSVSYRYNEHNWLSEIITESTHYYLNYDAFGNKTDVSIGESEIASYEYNPYNGKLNKVNYGNGFSEEYVYNELEMLSEIWYTYSNGTREQAYAYEYTAYGSVYKITDCIEDRATVYTYDTNHRLIGYAEYGTEEPFTVISSEIGYNDRSEHSLTRYKLNYSANGISEYEAMSYLYTYNTDGSLRKFEANNSGAEFDIDYTYDAFNRLSEYSVSHDGTGDSSFDYSVVYGFKEGGSETSVKVHTYTSQVNDETAKTYTYTYDAIGNITKVNYSTGEEIRYVYDDLNQLVREDNGVIGVTYVYTYDDAGNILSAKQYALTAEGVEPTNSTNEREYGYSTGDWGDMLTSYRGQPITYDAVGNPLSYYNMRSYTFTWEGRRLISATKNGTTITYTYGDDGMRTSKTVNGVTTRYYYDGSLLIAEQTGDKLFVYVYDSNGSPIGFQYREASYPQDKWDAYWYEKNLQGDIIAVYDSEGYECVSYAYNAWGLNTTVVGGGSDPEPYQYNPFRYRGYYYDADLSMYYLGSRYYDPQICRFINTDTSAVITATPTSLTDKNLYTYCDNNPVTRADNGGEFWHIIVGAAIGALISGVVKAVSNVAEGKSITDGLATAVISGAASGALAATGVGVVGAIAGNVAISMAENATNQVIENDGFENFDVDDMLIDGVVNGISAAVGGPGKGSAHLTNLGKQTVKRTFHAVKNKGIKAGLKEAGKAFAYYGKNSVKHYKGVVTELPSDFISAAVTSIASSSYMKDHYHRIFFGG